MAGTGPTPPLREVPDVNKCFISTFENNPSGSGYEALIPRNESCVCSLKICTPPPLRLLLGTRRVQEGRYSPECACFPLVACADLRAASVSIRQDQTELSVGSGCHWCGCSLRLPEGRTDSCGCRDARWQP